MFLLSYAHHLLCACWPLEAVKGSSSSTSCRLLILSRLPSSLIWAQLMLLVPALGIRPPLPQDGAPIHRVRAHSLTGIRNNYSALFKNCSTMLSRALASCLSSCRIGRRKFSTDLRIQATVKICASDRWGKKVKGQNISGTEWFFIFSYDIHFGRKAPKSFSKKLIGQKNCGTICQNFTFLCLWHSLQTKSIFRRFHEAYWSKRRVTFFLHACDMQNGRRTEQRKVFGVKCYKSWARTKLQWPKCHSKCFDCSGPVPGREVEEIREAGRGRNTGSHQISPCNMTFFSGSIWAVNV